MTARGRWIAFAGLPGTGKSTLARLLARELLVPYFDKDRVRAALHGPDGIRYERDQDDRCMELVYASARHVLASGLARQVILDGRTYLRVEAVQRLVEAAAAAAVELRVIECRCAAETARARIQGDLHPAANRTPELHDRLAAEACDLEHELVTAGASPPWVVDSEGPPQVLVAELVARLR